LFATTDLALAESKWLESRRLDVSEISRTDCTMCRSSICAGSTSARAEARKIGLLLIVALDRDAIAWLDDRLEQLHRPLRGAESPAGSFPGGFPTMDPAQAAPSTVAVVRNPHKMRHAKGQSATYDLADVPTRGNGAWSSHSGQNPEFRGTNITAVADLCKFHHQRRFRFKPVALTRVEFRLRHQWISMLAAGAISWTFSLPAGGARLRRGPAVEFLQPVQRRCE
jgi:hypothetical protein